MCASPATSPAIPPPFGRSLGDLRRWDDRLRPGDRRERPSYQLQAVPFHAKHWHGIKTSTIAFVSVSCAGLSVPLICVALCGATSPTSPCTLSHSRTSSWHRRSHVWHIQLLCSSPPPYLGRPSSSTQLTANVQNVQILAHTIPLLDGYLRLGS
ncbi:hypothetical protein H4582DRAFT_1997628 [Lactarius indigo]|nr:hypothetical protein H4582DRAFT_1997628 [Lactarius indigo]